MAVPASLPFESAGATIYASSDFSMRVERVPFVLPGAAVTTYPENSGPSTVQDATVKGISITAAKFAFLTKVSEEADADIPTLQASITEEGVRRIYSSTSAAATAALLTSLAAAGAAALP